MKLRMGSMVRWGLGLWISSVFGCGSGIKTVAVPTQISAPNLEFFETTAGMRIVIERIPNSNLTGFILLVDAGYAYGNPDISDVSHLTEHLVFQGQDGDCGTRESKLTRLGTVFNGWTTEQEQQYSVFTSESNFEPVLSTITGITDDPLRGVGAATFEEERQIVELEYRTRPPDVERAIHASITNVMKSKDAQFESTNQRAFNRVRSVTLEQVKAFAKQRFQKKYMTLYLRVPTSFTLTDQHKSQLGISDLTGKQSVPSAWSTKRRPSADESHQRTPGDLGTIVANVKTPQLWLSWPMKQSTYADIADANIIALRIKTALTYSSLRPNSTTAADCYVDEYSQVPHLSCRIELNPDITLLHPEKDVLGWLRTVFNSGFRKQAVLELFADKERLDFVMSDEPLFKHAVRLATETHRHGDPLFRFRVTETMFTENGSDIYQKGKDLMNEQRVFVTHVVPSRDSAFEAGTSASSKWQAREASPSCNDTRRLETSKFESGKLTKKTLPNGFEVLVAETQETPYVTAILGFRGGRAWATDKNIAYAAGLAKNNERPTSPVLKGLVTYSVDAVDVEFEATRTTQDHVRESIRHLKDEFQRHVTWPNKQFLKSFSSYILQDSALVTKHESGLLTATLGEHPYTGTYDLDHVRSVSRDQITRYLETVRRPDNGVLVVVGHVVPEDIMSEATSAFEDLNNPSVPKIEKPRPIAPTENIVEKSKYVVTHHPTAMNVRVKLQCIVSLSGPEDVHRSLLLENLATRQILKALRFDKTLIYSVNSDTEIAALGFTKLSFATEVPNELFGAFLRTLDNTFLKFDTKKESPEFDAAVNYRRTSVALAHSATANLAESIVRQWALGYSAEDVLRLDSRLAETQTQDLNSTIEQCKKTARIGLLGNEPVISTAISEL